MNRYGCWNTERKDGFYVRNLQLSPDWWPPKDDWKVISDTSTTECQYRKTTTDPKCEGCTK